ncbi:thiolase family protein [Staphylococcus aureus]
MHCSYGRSVAAKAKQGALFHQRPDDVAAKVLQGVFERFMEKFNKNMIEDVIVGTGFSRRITRTKHCTNDCIAYGIMDTVPGQTVNRYCSSGLQTIAICSQSNQWLVKEIQLKRRR